MRCLTPRPPPVFRSAHPVALELDQVVTAQLEERAIDLGIVLAQQRHRCDRRRQAEHAETPWRPPEPESRLKVARRVSLRPPIDSVKLLTPGSEWNPRLAASNRATHEVSFEEAATPSTIPWGTSLMVL